jgi:hypothetical protein
MRNVPSHEVERVAEMALVTASYGSRLWWCGSTNPAKPAIHLELSGPPPSNNVTKFFIRATRGPSV